MLMSFMSKLIVAIVVISVQLQWPKVKCHIDPMSDHNVISAFVGFKSDSII